MARELAVAEERTGRPPVATPVPFAHPAEVPSERTLVLPIMATLSLIGHGLVLAIIAVNPLPTSITPALDEIAIDVVATEPEPAPEPIVEPQVQPAAAPVRRVVREREEPAAPPPILTTETDTGSDFVVPPGDPEGVAGGREGGV